MLRIERNSTNKFACQSSAKGGVCNHKPIDMAVIFFLLAPTNWKVYLLSIAQSISLEIYSFPLIAIFQCFHSVNVCIVCLAFYTDVSFNNRSNSKPSTQRHNQNFDARREASEKKQHSHSLCFQIFSKDYIKYSSNKSRIFMSATYFTLVYAAFSFSSFFHTRNTHEYNMPHSLSHSLCFSFLYASIHEHCLCLVHTFQFAGTIERRSTRWKM